jgi:hypothetical protein
MLLYVGFVFYFFILFIFCRFFIIYLNKDYLDHWVVDVNSFLAFGLRRMSFSIEFSTPRAEEYELPMH